MNQIVFTFITQSRNYMLEEWMNLMKENADERLIYVVSDEMFVQTSAEFIDMIISNTRRENEEFTSKLSDFAEKVVRLGWPLSFIIEGLHKFTLVVINGMVVKEQVTKENQMEIIYDLDKWTSPMKQEIVSIYTQAWERTVSLQKNGPPRTIRTANSGYRRDYHHAFNRDH